MEYCKAFPIEELAVMVIVPSATPQSVGSVPTAALKVGSTLSTNTSVVPTTIQVSSPFLTWIS